MTVGLLIITHNNLGFALLETASKMLGHCPLRAKTLAVTLTADPDLLRLQSRKMLADLHQDGDGVLVLTDMFGSTPSNIATALEQEGTVAVVAGINLPMLVRVLNYPQLELAALVEKAVSGGHDGVVYCHSQQLG